MLEKPSEFGLLAELEGKDQKSLRSTAVWKQQKMDYRWDNEHSIKFWVKTVMDDCIESIADLYKMIYRLTETTLKNRERNFPDLTLFTKRQTSKGVDINFDKPGQLIQYMHDLRASCGVRFVIGIFTNYKKWCFYWFKDSDSAVKETNLDG